MNNSVILWFRPRRFKSCTCRFVSSTSILLLFFVNKPILVPLSVYFLAFSEGEEKKKVLIVFNVEILWELKIILAPSAFLKVIPQPPPQVL